MASNLHFRYRLSYFGENKNNLNANRNVALNRDLIFFLDQRSHFDFIIFICRFNSDGYPSRITALGS